MRIFKPNQNSLIGTVIAGLATGVLGGAIGTDAAHAQSFPFLSSGSTPFYSYAPATNYAPTIPSVKNTKQKQEADPYHQGKIAFGKGNYKLARKLWRPAAKAGHLFAGWRLANMYRLGQGTKVNHAKAFKHYKRVAQRHINTSDYVARTRVTVDSVVRLADYHRLGAKGTKIKIDHKRAFALYQLAATHYGHSRAQYALGLMYMNGQGVKKNTARGIRWLLLSARKHNPNAQVALGEIYWKGQSVRQNKARGLMWYILARDSSSQEKQLDIDERILGYAKQVDDESRDNAKKSASLWRKKYPLTK